MNGLDRQRVRTGAANRPDRVPAAVNLRHLSFGARPASPENGASGQDPSAGGSGAAGASGGPPAAAWPVPVDAQGRGVVTQVATGDVEIRWASSWTI